MLTETSLVSSNNSIRVLITILKKVKPANHCQSTHQVIKQHCQLLTCVNQCHVGCRHSNKQFISKSGWVRTQKNT